MRGLCSRILLPLFLGLAAAFLFATPPASAADDEAGFKPIFDGETLDGWDGNPVLWSVEDGAITGATTEENQLDYNQFIIWRDGEVDDFVLRLQYKIIGHNSGIQYRSFEGDWGDWTVGGYQADCEAGDQHSGILYGEKFRGILARRGEITVIGDNHKPTVVGKIGDGPEMQKYIKKEDWNDYEIVAKGYTFTHYINGHKMVEVTDEDMAERRRGGIVALQIHRGPVMKVQFRNIRLKRLPMEDVKKVVLIAGPPSHGYMGHEHNAGCLLLAKYLNEVPGIHAVVYQNGWPKDPTALDNADAIVNFCDGGGRNVLLDHMDEIEALMAKGVGLANLHYAVEVPKGDAGDKFLQWTGGYFEQNWSVNPHFLAEFTELPDHPITRGVKPFAVDDEWYYHMRFPEGMNGVTPILTCIPPDSTRERPDGHHSNNPTVRAGKGSKEHVAWAIERPDGGRGFGFTGGHWHWNWANDGFRTAVLNGIVWVAGMDVPEGGIQTEAPTIEDLEANMDFEPAWKRHSREEIVELIEKWKDDPTATME